MSDRPASLDLALGHAPTAAQAQRLLALSARLVPAQHVLAGRFMALMCRTPADPAAQRLSRAALDLGVQVTHVAPPFEGQRIDALARILDQLYDAVDCVGMGPTEVQLLARACRVPVFDSLAGADRPLAALALDAPKAPDAGQGRLPEDRELRHHRLVQAALVECFCGVETLESVY